MPRSMHMFLAWATILSTGAVAGHLAIGRAQEANGPAAGSADVRERTDVFLPRVRTAEPAAACPAKGHYQQLLQTLNVPQDRNRYGDFYDYGYWSGTSYQGHDHLPAGYWVYLAPNWYIYKDVVTGTPGALGTPRPWGPEQATGAPDTWPNAGDLTTAWASATPDGQREWLELTYDGPLHPVAVMIYETYNPGAVDRITGYDGNGREVELWSGVDPTPTGKDKGISVVSLHPDATLDLTRVRIYLDSAKVPGWNEIDAVGLLDEKGTVHWATGATASSTYADRTAPLPLGEPSVDRLEPKMER